MRDEIDNYWSDLERATRDMPRHCIAQAADLLLECCRHGGTVFILGNGGSAATASHFACDLAKGTGIGCTSFRVVSLTDNMPLLTAWANDTHYERVFAEQLSAWARPGDIVVAITASGDSPNVLAAAEVARKANAMTIALTGRTGGKVRRLSHLTVLVPSTSVELIEDAHLSICHSMCVALRKLLREEAESQEEQVPISVEDASIATEGLR
jgi:D-sedoheptulose 7-phosphate isomerase